ncbi:hypothetical protein [Phocicoccus pinnipedialis]|uniref:Uncharacterized protein n=1 Tax=Phocicoccus pinnipedialis TaxID=110845 RepID=A0A6V7R4L3_9BACL|nr:hypothetical protein [Jeotgalicoccus pinnipedialis]MBP1939644.1 hypothetical protein [Jeotgalicoccus pinnipedialis]CAD2072266.1 hypothetical protein JEOPIN946_00364 [Jeotgalicoccus pinnipedialis]
MKRSFVIGATIILAVALIVMGVKISQHTKYDNVFEEIYSITKTQETNIKSHEDKVYTYEVNVPKEELSNGIDRTVTTFHFDDDERLETIVIKGDSQLVASYKKGSNALVLNFTGNEEDKNTLHDGFYNAVVVKWFNERASRFSPDDLGELIITETTY